MEINIGGEIENVEVDYDLDLDLESGFYIVDINSIEHVGVNIDVSDISLEYRTELEYQILDNLRNEG